MDRLREIPATQHSTVLVGVEDNKGKEADGLTTHLMRRRHENVIGLADHAPTTEHLSFGLWTHDKAPYCKSFGAVVTAGKFHYYDKMFGACDFDSTRRRGAGGCGGRDMQRLKFEAQLRHLQPVLELAQRPLSVPRSGVTAPIDHRGHRIHGVRNDVAVVTCMAVHTWLRIQEGKVYAINLPHVNGLPCM